jgi:hypothetical protein
VAYFKTVQDFTARSVMTDEQISELENKYEGWLLSFAASCQDAEIDARLRKRYLAPFAEPVPECVKYWLARIITPSCYLKLGVRPSDEQQTEITKQAEKSQADIKEAADAKDGLFDLPLRADTNASGIEQPATLAYSEQSPYTSRHRQFDAVNQNRRYG